jgi:hypothetical protein
MRKRILLIVLIIILLVAGGAGYVFFKQNYNPQTQTKAQEIPLKYQKIENCSAGDTACTDKNEKIKANKLSGEAVEYAKHQCDGPHACPTPNPTLTEESIKAIRTSVKDQKLELIRMTGINRAGIIYYCAPDGKCWSVDTKTAEVTPVNKN